MRVAVDLRPLLEPFESGVSVYTKAILSELFKDANLDLDLFYQSRNRCEHIHELFPKARHIQYSNTLFHLRSLFSFPSLPDTYFKQDPDLIWMPDRRPFYKSKFPLLMTVHDSVPEKFKRSISLKGRLWHKIFSLKRLLKLVDGVLAPSFTTASILPRNMLSEVTYEGATLSKIAKKPSNADLITKKPFFFMIAPGDPRKRFAWFLNAAKKNPKVNFVWVGIKKSDRRFARTKMDNLANLFLFNEITESEKLWFYRNAEALLALSKYEGFDLPVLEAIEAKCSVIMSDISVHNELYRSNFPLVSNEDDLHLAIYKILNGESSVPKLRGNYTWENASKRTLLFFRRVILHKNR
ncbi:glycosyltransferase [Candidatus Peregrinibacteria bacterium]|nr:glycosyltransferase [Candidatus Peregrinibacteria bacterium]